MKTSPLQHSFLIKFSAGSLFLIGYFFLMTSIFKLSHQENTPRILTNIFLNKKDAEKRSRAITLNYFLPSFKELGQFILTPKEADKNALAGFERYYARVTENFPQIAEGFHLLGFCQYNLGKTREAIASYQKAIEVNPQLFWAHYNLGIILFTEKEYAQAVLHLEFARRLPINNLLNSITTSKIYQQILSETSLSPQSIVDMIKNDHTHIYELLTLSYRYLRQPQNKNPIPDPMPVINLNLRIL